MWLTRSLIKSSQVRLFPTCQNHHNSCSCQKEQFLLPSFCVLHLSHVSQSEKPIIKSVLFNKKAENRPQLFGVWMCWFDFFPWNTLQIFQELNQSLKHSSKHQSWHKWEHVGRKTGTDGGDVTPCFSSCELLSLSPLCSEPCRQWADI